MRISKVLKSCKEFFYRKDGASGIEYAIAAAMVAAVLTTFMSPISDGLKTVFTTVQTSLTSTANAGKPAGGGTN